MEVVLERLWVMVAEVNGFAIPAKAPLGFQGVLEKGDAGYNSLVDLESLITNFDVDDVAADAVEVSAKGQLVMIHL